MPGWKNLAPAAAKPRAAKPHEDHHISPQAEADLSDIWHYIAEDNLEAADRVIAKIKQIIANLSNSPKMGHCRDNFSRGLRSVPVGRYLIFYREIKERLEVVHVLHGARDITSDLF